MAWWEQVGRDIEFRPPEPGGAVIVGDANWAEALSPNSSRAAIFAAIGNNSYSPYGGFFGSRTSGGGGIGGMSLAVQDSKTPVGGAWSWYFETFKLATAHPDNTANGFEVAAINQSETCADSTPRFPNNPGVFDGFIVGVGKPECKGKEISTLGVFKNVEGTPRAKAKKGFVFHELAVKFQKWLHTEIAELFSMAWGHSFRWYDKFDRPSTTITCHVDHAEYAPHLDFTNGAVHFIGKDGMAQFSFNTETGVPYYGILAYEARPPTGASVGRMQVYIGGLPFYLPLYK